MIVYKEKTPVYYDKNGTEITENSFIEFPDKTIKKVFRTIDGELGTDATNPLWIKYGKACECEYGIYPLSEDETNIVVVVNEKENLV